jgi:hypothetical protein
MEKGKDPLSKKGISKGADSDDAEFMEDMRHFQETDPIGDLEDLDAEENGERGEDDKEEDLDPDVREIEGMISEKKIRPVAGKKETRAKKIDPEDDDVDPEDMDYSEAGDSYDDDDDEF